MNPAPLALFSYGLLAGTVGAFYVFAWIFTHVLSLRSLMLPLMVTAFLGAGVSFVLGRVVKRLPWTFLMGFVTPFLVLVFLLLPMNHKSVFDMGLLALPVVLAFASALMGGAIGSMTR